MPENTPPIDNPSKISLWDKIKRVLKWLFVAISLILFIGVGFAAYRLSEEDLFGWRLNFTLDKVETKDYNSFAPTIAFRYPEIFELDLDTDNKFGPAYLAGIKLKTDDRTGCDLRTGGPELDFEKSADELSQAIVGPIGEKASGLKVIEKKKMFLGGEPAFKVSFSFLDPIGARIRLDQLFTKGKGGQRYMIICGAGEYQFSFFEKDFEVFYDSVNFEGKLLKEDDNWKKLFEFEKN
ncbi:MAG: hypothetical protein A2288_02340 [Candidatus Moranbacteria bacterium RIFOXYA12_FULL_44_15]|nr:MAG: hypothetical protein A2288_02340 [Candidatus Moranbacteria bacterium RIFOXYA12_FULL_44_15]OGI34679.1 MAG: hypothetical protein A2259_04910 [Candidatus Moranbacteria bacterium RIFOXYA2_FULL_43_15]